MWTTLTNNLEVVWGAATAMVIVVLLTPAVGGLARRVGAMDEPDARRVHHLPVPRLGGVAAFASCGVALSRSRPSPAGSSAIVFGAVLGFLRHNFYPARVFMGDSGSMLLGFLLAGIAVQGLLKTAATVALFLPLLVLA